MTEEGRFQFHLILRVAEGTPVPNDTWTINLKDQSDTILQTLTHQADGGRIDGNFALPPPTSSVRFEFLNERFHPQSTGFFFARESRLEARDVRMFRVFGKWSPTFVREAQLPSPRFDTLRSVLRESNSVDLKRGGEIGDLGAQYDNIAGHEPELGKMALLNLYSVLLDEQDPIGGKPWFDYVKRIIRLDRERFLAEVDPGLYDSVQTIIRDIDRWKKEGYFLEASTILHGGNIPNGYPPPVEDAISVKRDYEQGNLQLTVSFLRDEERVVHVLDCDMDEDANLAAHTADIVKHEVTKGTAPVEMHDFIALHAAQQQADGISRCDLGYTLS